MKANIHARFLKRFVVLCACLWTLQSCDGWVYVQYNVVNDSDSTIKVCFRLPDSSGVPRALKSFYLSPGNRRDIDIQSIISNKVFDPDVGYDSLHFLKELYVEKPSGSRVNKNCKVCSLWSYRERDKVNADKDLHITSEDLRKE